MVYLIVFLFPFLAPFFRAQPFKGLVEIVFGIPLFLALVVLTGGLALLLWPIIGWHEMQNTWNYRRHGFCAGDHR